MNAIHVDRANLVGGPLDNDCVPVLADQDTFEFVTGNRVHRYVRIAETRVFMHSRIETLEVAGDVEIRSSSILPGQTPEQAVFARRMAALLSMDWVHKLRSCLG